MTHVLKLWAGAVVSLSILTIVFVDISLGRKLEASAQKEDLPGWVEFVRKAEGKAHYKTAMARYDAALKKHQSYDKCFIFCSSWEEPADVKEKRLAIINNK